MVDVNTYKSKVADRPTVFIFPGNSSHHADDLTLFSIKMGGGLAAAAANLGRAGYPTLSIPTTGKEKTLEALSIPAMSDIYRALGAGYSILIPVRDHKAHYPSNIIHLKEMRQKPNQLRLSGSLKKNWLIVRVKSRHFGEG